jgi:voltage-gated potassium channel
MWWGVATLTTVGYGDMYPITPLGKFLGSLIAILGVGLVALPAGILASGFSEEMTKRTHRRHDGVCPTCGQALPKKEHD